MYRSFPLRPTPIHALNQRSAFRCRGGTSWRPSNDGPDQPGSDARSASYSALYGSASPSTPKAESERFSALEPDLVAALSRQRFSVKEFGGILYQETKPSSRQGHQDLDQNSKKLFKVVFILGGPGAGKGTQSALMTQHFPVVHFSVGDLLRQEQAKTNPPSPYKEILDHALVHGSIVPVKVSLGLLQQAMQAKSLEMGNDILFLVDGFPRNFDNLKGWITVMKEVALLWSVLVYTCPLPVLEQRILERGKESGRSDDNLSSVKKRFATFERETMPVIDTLKAISKVSGCPWTVVDICGDRPLDNVWVASQQALNQLILHEVLSANAALLAAAESGDVATYQSLCDERWFESKSPSELMREQEGEPAPIGEITKAQLDFISGKQVAVGYERVIHGVRLREKRIWSHQGLKGWRNVHFSRTPSGNQ